MHTVSDFKKRLAIGVKLHAIFHLAITGWDENKKPIYGDEDKGVREVSIVQTNSFALKTTKSNGEVVDSWCAYPKASECKVVSQDMIVIYENWAENNRTEKNLIPVLTYKFI